MKSTVALIRCDSYENSTVTAALRRGIGLLGGLPGIIRPEERIVLKPNCLYGVGAEKCTTTHPALVRAAAVLCREAGAKVLYGDSPAAGSALSGMRAAGYDAVARDLGIELADFDKGQSVGYPGAREARNFVLANGVLDNDGLISLSKCKTHGLMRFTGAVKNQYGCIPGFLKAQYHGRFSSSQEFARFLVDINTFLKPRLYIMDAVMAMEGNGPGNGDPRKLGLLLLSTDPVALDATACRIIDLDPSFVPTMAAGEEAGLGVWREDQVVLTGDPLETFRCSSFNVARRPAGRGTGGPIMRSALKFIVDRPAINTKKCIRCGKCVEICPTSPKSVDWRNGDKRRPPRHDYDRCIRCFCCQEICPADAISVQTPILGALATRSAMMLLKAYRAVRQFMRGR